MKNLENTVVADSVDSLNPKPPKQKGKLLSNRQVILVLRYKSSKNFCSIQIFKIL